MARYNTQLAYGTINTTGLIQTLTNNTTLTTPYQGLYTEAGNTTSAPFTITLPAASAFPGATQTFFNNSSYTVTLTSGGGNFVGSIGSASLNYTLFASGTVTIFSDGAVYACLSGTGGGVSASTFSASSTVTLSPANANVTLSPSGTGQVTISPATTGSISNMTFTAGGLTTLQQTTEVLATSASPGGTVTLNYNSGDIVYVTGMSTNFTLAITNVPTTLLRAITITLIMVQGGTAYIPSAVTINGAGASITWPAGITPAGTANRVNIATFFIVNATAAPNYVLGQISEYG
jgi:hypothetical protein